jgi:hypothetical protein
MNNSTPSSPLAIDRLLEMDWEDSHAEIAKLEDATIKVSGGVTVHSGKHPEHGNIHIILPPFGMSILCLPFAIRSF